VEGKKGTGEREREREREYVVNKNQMREKGGDRCSRPSESPPPPLCAPRARASPHKLFPGVKRRSAAAWLRALETEHEARGGEMETST